MNIDPIVLSIPFFILALLAEIAFQLYSKRKLYRLADAITSISCGIIEQLAAIYRKTLTVALYHILYTSCHLFTIPASTLTFCLLFVLADLCYYWSHRASHRVNLFWGGHVVHHQSEDYNLSTALRQGLFQAFFTVWFYLPLALIGFDTASYALAYALVTIYQFWIHTEAITKLGPLELILNTPSHHRVHHGKDPEYIDMNYAGVFIIWDKLFGTFIEEGKQPTYGVTKPTNSWNPLWVNLVHYQWMWQQLKALPSWKTRLLFLVKPPGWSPEGMEPIPPITATPKYDVKPSLKTQGYVAIHYLIILLFSAWVMFSQKHWSEPEKLAGIGLGLLGVITMGGLMESKRWALPLEVARLTGMILYLKLSWLWLLPTSLISLYCNRPTQTWSTHIEDTTP